MMIKTHLAIGLLLVALFTPHVHFWWFFVPVVLIASVLPDIDTAFSTIGKQKVFRMLQVFTRHRGFVHSFTFAIIISTLLAIFFPILAFGFFLGYSIHLLVDSFTIEGIRPFWPLKDELQGRFRVGGKFEDVFFVVFIVLDIIFFVAWFI